MRKDPKTGETHADQPDAVRKKLGDEQAAKHGEAVKNAVQGLTEQIALEQALAKVQKDGAEAVRQVTLEWQIRQAVAKSATAEQIALMRQLSDEENKKDAGKKIDALNQETAALQRMTAAVWGGVEATRTAALENKYVQMKHEGGASPEVDEAIDATKARDASARQQELAAEAAKLATSYGDSLQHVNDMIGQLQAARNIQGDTLGIEIALRDLENERLKLMADQVLQQGRAQDGVRAFFLEMQQMAKSTGSIIYDALNRSLEESSSELAKAMTGQKTSFGKMFQGIGTQILTSSIKSDMQKGLGAVGKMFGIDTGSLTKPDGSKSNPFYMLPAGGGFGLPLATGVPPWAKGGGGLSGDDSSIFGGGDQGDGIFSAFGKGDSDDSGASANSGGGSGGILGALIGAFLKNVIPHAAGGDVSPSSAYLVGEQGPELLFGASGRIASNSESRRMVAGVGATYLIDARGTDAALVEDRVKKALVIVHGSAISTSVQTVHDMQRRMPQRS